MDNWRKFQSIVAEILQVSEDEVNDALSPDRVDTWDSLNHINLISALEQEFDVMLTTDDLADAMSIPKLKALLAEQGVTLTDSAT